MSNLSKNKVLQIQDRLLREAKTATGVSLKRVLDKIVRLLYIEPGQFILEFLQNAEDALMEEEKKRIEAEKKMKAEGGKEAEKMEAKKTEVKKIGYFKVELYKDKVIISNNGKPFDNEDLENLCAIKSGKKPALGYKGFIGIGWKSVYKVSTHIEVCSAGICFEFNKDYWSRPEVLEILSKYNLTPDDVLWQITPIPIQPTEALTGDETRFVIHLQDELKYNEIVETVEKLGPSLVLFLDHVNRIIINDWVRNKHKLIEWATLDQGEYEGVKVKRVLVVVHENGSTKGYKFLVFKKEFEVPQDVKMDPVTVDAERSDVKEREVAIAFALDPATEDLKPVDGEFWMIYSFLPLHEVRTGLGFLIQADFIVHPGRRYLNVEAKWNHWLMKSIAELLKVAVRYLSEIYRRSYLQVFDCKEIGDEVWKKLIEPYVVKTVKEELKNPEVLCINGDVVRLDQAVKPSDEIVEFMEKYGKYGLFDERELKYVYGTEKHILDPKVKLPEKGVCFTPEKPPLLLTIESLLNKELIEAKIDKDVNVALEFLEGLYRIADQRHVLERIPEEKRFIITSSGSVKLARDAYLPMFPPQIEEWRREFPEIDSYLRSLDFVHERLIERVGVDVLKRLGVKVVNLKEIAEKMILEHLRVRDRPPEKERLVAATVLVKQAGISVTEPIWVLTKDGVIENSYNVWNPEIFKDLEDAAKLLGVRLLDIHSYIKYDNDPEGWKKFFSESVRGYKLHDVYYYYCYKRDYVNEIINKVKDVVEKATVDDNLKLIRFLKRLHESMPSSCWGKIKLKLVTDDGSTGYSDQLLLHDSYDAEEKWYRWKKEGFDAVGSFVSPNYPEKPEEVSSWKKFLVDVLDVKKSVSDEVIGRFAEWFVKRRLAEKGYEVKGGSEGCDFNIVEKGELICVEVKGSRKNLREVEEVRLSEKGTKVAFEQRERFWLVVIESIPNDPRARLVRNPIRLIGRIGISGKQIAEHGEDL
jgi:hypothetical protein